VARHALRPRTESRHQQPRMPAPNSGASGQAEQGTEALFTRANPPPRTVDLQGPALHLAADSGFCIHLLAQLFPDSPTCDTVLRAANR